MCFKRHLKNIHLPVFDAISKANKTFVVSDLYSQFHLYKAFIVLKRRCISIQSMYNKDGIRHLFY